ncbi:DUF1801 domain-containing protein [Schlesneria sp. DSM 10557]|uniref:DUF1801 domain-containing protein n=1 Tax=Schlesneria sp. DSM 10557 TaxID=3044399 RepID=UPI0035A0B050
MSEQKTRPTEEDVTAFIAAVPEAQKREDSYRLLELMQQITGESPRMWGPSMIGFGEYHYRYPTGHEGDTFVVGFSPRKTAFSLYLSCDLETEFGPLLQSLGKFKQGKGCLYVKRLADIDLGVLRELIESAVAKVVADTSVKVNQPDSPTRK